MITGVRIGGRAFLRVMVCTPGPGILKVMVLIAGKVLAKVIALRSEVKPSLAVSPKPDASGAVLEKNSMRKRELGVLWSAAFTVVVLPTDAADEITGKFWKLFGPLWPLESLGVTPSFPRSIPSWALEKIELLRME